MAYIPAPPNVLTHYDGEPTNGNKHGRDSYAEYDLFDCIVCDGEFRWPKQRGSGYINSVYSTHCIDTQVDGTRVRARICGNCLLRTEDGANLCNKRLALHDGRNAKRRSAVRRQVNNNGLAPDM